MRAALIIAFFSLSPAFAQSPPPPAPPTEDVIIRAMRDELERSRSLRIHGAEDPPYYIEYTLEDIDSFTVSASLGGLLGISSARSRVPDVQVRVGAYEFDNTNDVASGHYSGERFDPDRWPIDNSYEILRQDFWLATDRAYKTAVESLSRKRAALRDAAVNAKREPEADFLKASPSNSIQAIEKTRPDQAQWSNRVVKLSGVFAAYPEVLTSATDLESIQATAYYANSEGTLLRTPDNFSYFRIRASGIAPDGMVVRDAAVIHAFELSDLGSEGDLSRSVAAVADNVKALAAAPVGESYIGPMLFEPRAAAQLLAQVLGDNLRVGRRPVVEPGRTAPYIPSEFESRMGSRVIPEWIDVIDDATRKEWKGKALIGYTQFDMEGVKPRPVTLIEKGVLKSFLLSRQPVKGYSESNGHARLPGSFGYRAAAISNLFIKTSQSVPLTDLKKQLIDLCKQRNKTYGILVRKLDFPSSASVAEFRSIATGMMQSGGGAARPVSIPLLVYRVYLDGREELIRSVRFRGVNVKTLKDILAASTETALFEYVNNGAPFAIMGGGGYIAPTSVVAPGLLFDEVELEHPQDELAKPPLVPAPTLVTGGR